MKNRTLFRVLVILLAVTVFFGLAQSASADIKATNVFRALSDENPPVYKWSQVTLELDGEATHVIHEFSNDGDDFFYTGDLPNTPQYAHDTYDACQAVFTNTAKLADCPYDDNLGSQQYEEWAGVLELGIPHEDIGNGAKAFEYSDSWTVIDCDLDGDDDFDNDDLDVDTRLVANYPQTLAPWDSTLAPNTDPSGWNFKVLAEDDLRNCKSQTCQDEWVTTIFLDLDFLNDDNVLDQCPAGTDPNDGSDPQFQACELPASGALCFFAEIYPITYTGGPVWSGNAQARFGTGGGDKTVNFNVAGPDAITLENLVAQSPGGIHPFVWLTIAMLLTGIAFVLIRESRIQKREIFVRKDE